MKCPRQSDGIYIRIVIVYGRRWRLKSTLPIDDIYMQGDKGL